MKNQLRQRWAGLAPVEKKLIAIAGGLLLALFYIALVQVGGSARTGLKASVVRLQAEATRLAAQAAEFERLQATPPARSAATNLVALVQAQALAAGLSPALGKVEALGGNQVALTFPTVPFGDWLRWIDRLQTQHIRLSACRVTALPATGMVSVTATLQRDDPP